MDKILLTGGTGALGKELISQGAQHFHIIFPTRGEMDILDISAIESFVSMHEPKYLIHAAAITKTIEEDDTTNVVNVNIIGTANIVKVCKNHGIKLIYISTDRVYVPGSRPIKETDPVCPSTNYSWSKLGGECSVQMYDNSLVLRLSFMTKPFPFSNGASNVIRNLQYIDEVSKTILSVLDEKGVLNIGAPQAKSMYQLGLETNPGVRPVNINEELANEKSIILDVSKLTTII